jgi:large subunit ribosomal protein L10
MKRNDKIQFIEDYTEKFGNAVLTVLADYRGLDVDTVNAMRSELRKIPGGEYRVVKNSLCRRILADTEKDGLIEHFVGPTSVYFSYEDPVAPTKKLVEFQKAHAAFEIKAAFFDGEVLTPEQVDTLSKMPSKKELQAMLLSVLQAPPRNFVSLLANVPRGLVNVLNAYKLEKEENDAA